MLTAFVRAFQTPDLRKKLLITLGLIALFRFGASLPTPRSVISSPSHMMTVVPATMVITIVAMVKTESFGMIGLFPGAPQPLNRVPDLASST